METKQRGTHAHFPSPRPPSRGLHDPLRPSEALSFSSNVDNEGFVNRWAKSGVRAGFIGSSNIQKNALKANEYAPPIHACDNHQHNTRMFGIKNYSSGIIFRASTSARDDR